MTTLTNIPPTIAEDLEYSQKPHAVVGKQSYVTEKVIPALEISSYLIVTTIKSPQITKMRNVQEPAETNHGGDIHKQSKPKETSSESILHYAVYSSYKGHTETL